MKTPLLLALLAIPFLFSQCNESATTAGAPTEAAVADDLAFARSAFESLARGDSSVAEKIDWPVFSSLGQNLGADYTALTSGVEKEKFANGYITQFAVNFRESGGTIEGFSNWRVVSSDALKTEVAADSANGVLTVTVSERDGVDRISSINVIK